MALPGRAATTALAVVVLAGILFLGGASGRASQGPGTSSETGFRFADVSDKSLGLWEGGKPVLVYSHGVIRKEGAPADRAPSSYVHPLYGLDGEVLTDDFPKDHYHHRGLFWSWPHVKIAEKEYSLWDLRGIRHQFVRWIEKDASTNRTTLAVENGWYVGSEKVVQEKIWLRVHPATAIERAIDAECEWVPVKAPNGTQATGKASTIPESRLGAPNREWRYSMRARFGLRQSPAAFSACADGKAPEGWRSPKPGGQIDGSGRGPAILRTCISWFDEREN